MSRRITIVGINYLTVATEAPGAECIPKCEQARAAVPVYNVVPFFGVPSMVAFPNATGKAVYIVGSLESGRPARHLHDQRHPSPPEGGRP